MREQMLLERKDRSAMVRAAGDVRQAEPERGVAAAVGTWGQRFAIVVCVLALLGAASCKAKDARAPMEAVASAAKSAVPAQHASWQEIGNRPVLIVVHPTESVLRNFVALKRNKLLNVPKLFVMGLYHADESRRYRRARKYARDHASWIGFRQLRCPLSAKDVYRANRCTPSFERLFEHATGIVFTGGADMPPALYGEPMVLTTMTVDPQRHYWETSFLFHLVGGSRGVARKPLLARRSTFPLLALCLGMQQLNVAAGGTLIQDIPSKIYGVDTYEGVLALPAENQHRNPVRFLNPSRGIAAGVMHPIRFTGAMEIWRAVMSAAPDADIAPVRVVSVHHQAVGRLGRQLQLIATSTDGKVAEALRHRRFTHVLALQFHPERDELWSPDKRVKLSADHPIGNVYAETLATDKRSLAFHVGLWRLFSEWLRTEWASTSSRTH